MLETQPRLLWTRTRAAVVLLSGCALAVCGGPAAHAARTDSKTVTSTNGAVTASFSYKRTDGTDYSGMRVKIKRAGAVRLRASIGSGFAPGSVIKQKPIEAIDLDADGEPEVLLPLFSRGAHCCVVVRVFRYRPASSSYATVKHDFGDVGFDLRNLDRDGPSEFLSKDPAFSGAFTSYAESRFPIQILRFRAGRFVDVTGSFPALVRKDVAAQKAALRRFRKAKYNARGALAALAADQYRLDPKTGAATVARGRALYGATYARSLRKLLRAGGYL